MLVMEAGGYNLYARLRTAERHNLHHFIQRHGPLVHALKNPCIFSTRTILYPLQVMLSGLLYARVEVCMLEAFGTKAEMDLLEQLAEMQVDEPNLEERIDIGISAKCLGIPLFTCVNQGKVFPLLHMAGFCNGSVTLERCSLRNRSQVCHRPYSESPHQKPPPHYLQCPHHNDRHLPQRGPN